MRKASLAPYVPRLVVDWVQPGPCELQGSLVSVDVTGFTSLSERLEAKGRLGAEELVLLLSAVFEGLIGISNRFGGDVLQFRGDALLLFFDGELHERRACRAAADMQRQIEHDRQGYELGRSGGAPDGGGVDSGACQFFVVEGSRRHRVLVVTGRAATATARLEDEADAGEILIDAATAAALDESWLGEERVGGRLLARAGTVPEQDQAPMPWRDELELYVAEPLRAELALETVEAEHRQVTAGFLKFAGVDDLPVEDAYERLSALVRVTGETCAEFGLLWLETDIEIRGGKFYLVAGAPSSSGDDEERMLRAMRTIVDSFDALVVRAGVNRGRAFCGTVGHHARRTYAVMGDNVNLAARLAGSAAAGEIIATDAVLTRSRMRFESQPVPLILKGKEQSITARRVGAVVESSNEDPAEQLPLVGRETELALLEEALNAARTRHLRLVELVGEPGLGKTRLVEELKRQAVGFTHLGARCDHYSTSRPYLAMRRLLRPIAGITPELDAEAAGVQLAQWVGAFTPDLTQWLPLIAIPFEAAVAPTPETDQIDLAFRLDRLHDAVDQFLSRVLPMPALFIVEDAHWLDDASRELLRHLTRNESRPWLVCITQRPQGVPLAGDTEGHIRVELEPLRATATRALALAAAGEEALSSDVLVSIESRSGGNPLFVRELVAAALAMEAVDVMPEKVETLITARIDTLAPEDRSLLRNASVLGTHFRPDLLGEVLADEVADVDDTARWARLGEFLLWDGWGELRFRHDLFRTVAYEGLSFRRRREVHARLGAALERRGADDALLSLHFYEAGRFDEAWITLSSPATVHARSSQTSSPPSSTSAPSPRPPAWSLTRAPSHASPSRSATSRSFSPTTPRRGQPLRAHASSTRGRSCSPRKGVCASAWVRTTKRSCCMRAGSRLPTTRPARSSR